MVWSNGAQVAHADAPSFLTQNSLEGTTITPASKWTLDGNFATADASDGNFPAYAAFDRNGAWHTQPTGATTVAYYMGRTVNSKTFNTIIIQGLNAATETAGVTVAVRTADSEDFVTNPALIHSFGTVTTDNRLVAVLTGVTARWNTDRIRVEITPVTPPFVNQPTLTQVFLTDRHVLGRQPNHPWDELAFGSTIRATKTISGVITIYGHDTSGRIAKMTFRSGVDTDRNNLRTAFAEMDYAGKPFYFMDRPNTIPADVWLMAWKNPQLVNELFKGVSGRQTSIQMEEGSPYLAEE